MRITTQKPRLNRRIVLVLLAVAFAMFLLAGCFLPNKEGDIYVDVPAAPRIYVPNRIAETLSTLYQRFGEGEFKFCLHTQRWMDGSESVIRNVVVPDELFSGEGLASSKPCKELARFEISGHSHPSSVPANPYDNCALSEQDIIYYVKRDPTPYVMLWCGPRTYAWWSRAQIIVAYHYIGRREGSLGLRPITVQLMADY